jgi:hypothetical protein
MTFFATASGLMIERVRSNAMTSTFSLLQGTISGRRRVRAPASRSGPDGRSENLDKLTTCDARG